MAKAKLKNASVAETSPLSPACYFACKKYYEIGEHNNPDPLWLVVREIDMAQPGNPHAFVFHRPDYRWPYSERAPVIQSLRDGIYRRGKPVNQYYRPLDVKLSAPTCFVFCLSDRWNWRFSSKVRAASLAEDDSQTRKYSKLRHYLHDNDGQYEPFEFARELLQDHQLRRDPGRLPGHSRNDRVQPRLQSRDRGRQSRRRSAQA